MEGKAPTGEGLELDEEEQKRAKADQDSSVMSVDDVEDDPLVQQQKVCMFACFPFYRTKALSAFCHLKPSMASLSSYSV